MSSSPAAPPQPKSQVPALTHLTVAGFKSLRERTSIELGPLTLLAGANSSGKSSIMQPLLMMKQTLEAPYDPGALLLNGPNVRFTSAGQFLTRVELEGQGQPLLVGLSVAEEGSVEVEYGRHPQRGLDIERMMLAPHAQRAISIHPDMSGQEILELLPRDISLVFKSLASKGFLDLTIVKNRCFLALGLELKPTMVADAGSAATINEPLMTLQQLSGLLRRMPQWWPLPERVKSRLSHLIHLPGLRGNPERAYPLTQVGPLFPGTFDKYAASVIAQWQESGAYRELEGTREDLAQLGLTWTVSAQRLSDTQVGLQVGRTSKRVTGTADDLVDITDVGFGVSQVLPVIVALHAAQPEHLVYIEQPELHLHPRAQSALAQVLVRAARRGVRVVAETHSSLLLLGIQTLVARGEIPGTDVHLHWFSRNEEGYTQVRSTTLDARGAFGDWPEDFDETALRAQAEYLDAVEEAGRQP